MVCWSESHARYVFGLPNRATQPDRPVRSPEVVIALDDSSPIHASGRFPLTWINAPSAIRHKLRSGSPRLVAKMQNAYEIHYLVGKTKRTVTVPAPNMDSSLALKIAITHAGACAGSSLPLPALREILGLLKQWKVANVRWNKAVSFTRREVTLQHQQLVCPRLLEDTARQACTRIACLSNPEVCASNHQSESTKQFS